MDDIQNFATKLFDFARNGDATLLEYIKQGVNVDMVNQDGQSFIMLAAYHGHAELVRQLVAAGADVNLLNDRGQSPLAGAIFKKEDAVIEALLAAGADPAAGQPNALDSARMFGREDLLERLS
ncbi:ankyrin repeat domain-containing protein [Corynebacterium aurimucosum]|uniref:ankyrin repeat domain-containing protein n=1 Tax=Corynebacterium aurimucosum TaxID=169292 RepID=UPI00187A4906|nr:ankyrin repeat domain-containing protein [Corynebacterium aurimucosum]MBE7365470.1 ankyrin repeat domain-containing protein [Corynebacterium aurimucosum]